MEAALIAFLSHPTGWGAVIVLVGLFGYAVIRGTAAWTRGADALVGIRVDFAESNKENRSSHTTTQDKIGLLRTDVDGIKSRLDGTKAEIIVAIGHDGNLTRSSYDAKRLSDIEDAALRAADEARDTREAFTSNPPSNDYPPPPRRTRTGAGGPAHRG